jgi:CHAT domain-containing protein
VADLEAQLAQAEADYAEALAAIQARGDQLAALVSGRGAVLGLAEVQALLDPQTTLLSYFVLQEQTLVFVITPDSFEVVELEISSQRLINQVIRLRDLIAFQEPGATRSEAQELYQILVAPLAASLRTPRLAIVPHGPLHYLPFAVLLNPDTDQYLLQDYSLVTLPSASALPFIQENAGEGGDGELVLVLGNPATGDLDATASLAVERDGLDSLPFAEQEAEAIAALYGVEPLIGEAATEGAVRSGASGAELLHLAAHGHFNPVAPLSSLIALAPDEAYDGWLTAGEVYGLDLSQADLVVLSACQTQLGELSAGDELVGLTRAFFFAGTPTVVASLWSVEDEATSVLMERFHTHLSQGVGKAEALRQAQLEMMADPERADPYYWSGFVMSGDGGEVGETPPPGPVAAETEVSGEGELGETEVSGEAEVEGTEEAGEAEMGETEVSGEAEVEETEGTGEMDVGETPAPSVEAPASRPPSWLWLVVGVGLLIVVAVGGMLWRRAKRPPMAEG